MSCSCRPAHSFVSRKVCTLSSRPLPAFHRRRDFHIATRNPAPSSDDIRWPKSSNPSPYEIFGLPPSASASEIKKRYYQLARIYHPDSRAASAEAEQERLHRFRQVVQANELLSAARSRRMYDKDGYGWDDLNVNDIMNDPVHWRGNYEGRYQSARSTCRTSDDHFESFFDGNTRAQPYYTSNANFAGGIIVIMVLAGVVQLSRIQNETHKASEKRRVAHEQASLNLRDARTNAKISGRDDMIETFQQRRGVYVRGYDEMENLWNSRRRR
jgi:DnaJ-class molecular chaperone